MSRDIACLTSSVSRKPQLYNQGERRDDNCYVTRSRVSRNSLEGRNRG